MFSVCLCVCAKGHLKLKSNQARIQSFVFVICANSIRLSAGTTTKCVCVCSVHIYVYIHFTVHSFTCFRRILFDKCSLCVCAHVSEVSEMVVATRSAFAHESKQWHFLFYKMEKKIKTENIITGRSSCMTTDDCIAMQMVRQLCTRWIRAMCKDRRIVSVFFFSSFFQNNVCALWRRLLL